MFPKRALASGGYLIASTCVLLGFFWAASISPAADSGLKPHLGKGSDRQSREVGLLALDSAALGGDVPASGASISTTAGVGIASTASTIAAVLPRVLVLIDPSLASPWGVNYAVFKRLTASLEKRGVPLVNPRFNQAIHWTAHQQAKSSTARAAAARMGLSYQAAVVITFSCKTLKMGFGGDLERPYLFRATVSGYVLEAASGRAFKQMIIVHRLGNGVDEQESEEQAVSLAADAFAREAFIRVNEWAHRREERGDPFLVRFLAVADYGEARVLRKALEGVPSLSAAVQKSISIGDPEVENTSEVSVIYKGSVEGLCVAVRRALAGGTISLVASVRPRGRHLVEVRLSHDGPAGKLKGGELGSDSFTNGMVQRASTATVGVRSPVSGN